MKIFFLNTFFTTNKIFRPNVNTDRLQTEKKRSRAQLRLMFQVKYSHLLTYITHFSESESRSFIFMRIFCVVIYALHFTPNTFVAVRKINALYLAQIRYTVHW